MSSKLYLTIAAVLAILYGIGFVLIPAKMGELYGVQPEPHAILNVQYFGSALLAWGVIMWFARDLDWAAVRGVLIGSVVGDAVGGLLILLRHEFLRRDGFAITELQQGHRGRLLTRAPINRRRMVAIEFGM